MSDFFCPSIVSDTLEASGGKTGIGSFFIDNGLVAQSIPLLSPREMGKNGDTMYRL